MKNYAIPYDSMNGDRKYNADDFSEFLALFFSNGVVQDGLFVEANGDMSFTVHPGAVMIGGKGKRFTTPTTITLPIASGSMTRVDTIVVRRDDNKRDFEIDCVEGQLTASPEATAPNRSGAIYELVLATIRVERGTVAITQSAVTDTRPYNYWCGYVAGTTAKDLKPERLLMQIRTKWEEWFVTMKEELDTNQAGHLQQQIDELRAKISSGTKLPADAKEGDIFILLEE